MEIILVITFKSVDESSKNKIRELIREEQVFSLKDSLVHLTESKVNRLLPADFMNQKLELKPFLPLVKEAGQIFREQGIDPLCVAFGLIEWEINDKLVNTPILLAPCSTQINKASQTIQFNYVPETIFPNPFLIRYLSDELEIALPTLQTLEEWLIFLADFPWKIEANTVFTGNFHHHRFAALRELEVLTKSELAEPLRLLLGDEAIQRETEMPLSSQLLFPADADQLHVFELLKTQHVVVQGPPGTGKSQVLANLTGKLLADRSTALIVSEKRVALEVIQQKLKEKQLEELCFIAGNDTTSKTFIQSLKTAWEQLEQPIEPFSEKLELTEEYLNQLQFTLDLLHQPGIIGGIDYHDFNVLSRGKAIEKSVYNSDLPELKEWLAIQNEVKLLYQHHIAQTVGLIRPDLFRHSTFSTFDQQIRSWLDKFQQVKALFGIQTGNDLEKAMKKAALCQTFSQQVFRQYQAIFKPDSREQRRFRKLYKNYTKLRIELNLLEPEQQNWLVQPTREQLIQLRNAAEKTSFFGKMRFSKLWKKWSSLPEELAIRTLDSWNEYLEKLNLLSVNLIDFCELGITDGDTEIDYVHQQLQQNNAEKIHAYLEIPERERDEFASKNELLLTLYHQLKRSVQLTGEEAIEPALEQILNRFGVLQEQISFIQLLPGSILRNLRKFATFEALENAVIRSNEVKFISRFPQLEAFSAAELLRKAQTIIQEQELAALQLSTTILIQRKKQFDLFHQLLQTASAKLSPEDKKLKEQLKKGKAILVKAFGKSRNFPALRELFESEARLWIQLLKPVWLSNPVQVANSFPLENGLFDLVIFDESGQIPLQHALGSVQRAKRVLIAGDQQQMGPHRAFSHLSADTSDLLHQASFYFVNTALKHHYRSQHPDLIAFSNQHFYQNQLLAYPAFDAEKLPVQLHFTVDGIYEDRRNLSEAKQVAAYLEQHIRTQDHLGIVAFSEIQLATIYAALKPETQQQLDLRLELGTAFFKALENVQGDECDHLIISLGYGKNETGDFHLRFGPLTNQNGSRRLNVLFSRARKKIDFFHSVKSSDFKLSSNEAVNLLRQFIRSHETDAKQAEMHFPFVNQPEVQGNKLIFRDAYLLFAHATELVTTVRVLQSRGWTLIFE